MALRDSLGSKPDQQADPRVEEWKWRGSVWRTPELSAPVEVQ